MTRPVGIGPVLVAVSDTARAAAQLPQLPLPVARTTADSVAVTAATPKLAPDPTPLVDPPPLKPEFLTAANAVLASVGSPDAPIPALYGVHLDLEHTMTSWKQFPGFLSQLRAIQVADPQHRPVVLDLNVHGNNGTGLKLAVPGDGDTLSASIASVAWVNQEIRKAGFHPGNLIVTSEACNGGHSYTSTVDGMDDEERDAAVTQARALVKEEGGATKLTGVELFDVLPTHPGQHAAVEADRGIVWIGRPTGVNFGGTVLAQVLTKHGLPGLVSEGAAAAHIRHRHFAISGRRVPPDSRLVVQNHLKGPVVSESEVTWPRDHRQRFAAKILTQAPDRRTDADSQVPPAPFDSGPDPTEVRPENPGTSANPDKDAEK